MKLIKTIRTHWKKSIFFTGLSVVGCKYGYNWYKENLLLRQYCLAIRHHSLQKVDPERSVKQIVVFLNKSAAEGRAAKTFAKFAVPMLSMSGVNFVVVPTSYEGHVTSLLKYLPTQIEAVVVAGGDGMLQDAITAVLRNDKCKHLPVGFIPLGTNNTFIRRLLSGADELSHVDKICQSVINIVEGNVEKVPIMAITPAKGNTIYATSYFTWGCVKSAIDFIPKFWWCGRGKTMFAMLRFSASTTWPCNIRTQLDEDDTKELANLTVLPGENTLMVQTVPAIQERLEFLESVGLSIHDNRHGTLLDLLTLHQPPPQPHGQEISVQPMSEGKFFVDGESVDCRAIRINYLADTLSMFVPRNPIPRAIANVLPDVPNSFANFM